MEAVRVKEWYAIKNAVALRKQENAALKAKTAVDKLKDKFDLERIGLTVALNAATDEETKLRIKSQLAILDNNEALAKKYLAEMKAAEAAAKLAGAYDTALTSIKSLISRINDFILKQGGTIAGTAPTTPAPSNTFTPLPASYFQDLAVQLVGTSSYSGMSVSEIATERARESGNRSVDVNLVVNSPSGDRFAQLVAESIQIAGRSGYNTAPAGSLP
jgi:hypothetical protein